MSVKDVNKQGLAHRTSYCLCFSHSDPNRRANELRAAQTLPAKTTECNFNLDSMFPSSTPVNAPFTFYANSKSVANTSTSLQTESVKKQDTLMLCR